MYDSKASLSVRKPLDGWELLTVARWLYVVAGSVTLDFAQSYPERVTLLNIHLTKSAELLTEALCAVMGISEHSTVFDWFLVAQKNVYFLVKQKLKYYLCV